jgi:hypothetical protein
MTIGVPRPDEALWRAAAVLLFVLNVILLYRLSR